MQVVKANGLHFHTRSAGTGSGPVLVFINSLGTDFRVWSEAAEQLAASHRVLLYDKRGHGLSDTTPGPYAMQDHVADLAALLTALDLREVVLCGLSVGGMIAQGLALSRPDGVRGLVLSNTAHRIGSESLWQERISAIEAGGIGALADPIIERWFSASFRRERPAEVAVWRNMLVRTPIGGYLGTCAALRDADYTDQLGRIRVPALCLGGSEDGATPPALVRELADRLPRARYHEIQRAGHLPCAERPAEVADLIDAFLRENSLG